MTAGPTSIAESLEWFRKRFRPDLARGVAISYQFVLDGGRAGVVWVAVDDGRLELDAGERPGEAPDVIFRLSASDFFAILAGTQNPDLLFMADRLQAEGDLSLALKVRSLFSTPA